MVVSNLVLQGNQKNTHATVSMHSTYDTYDT